MATSYSTLLGLALPVQGELSGTWGDTVNNYITNYLDSAIAGALTISTDADATLTKTTGSSLGSTSSQYAIIIWAPASGTLTRTITAPAASKVYYVINASGGTQSIILRGATPTTGVTIVKGEAAVVAWNGSDFVKVASRGVAGDFTTLNATGNVTLGDATTDTVTVAGYASIGGTATSSVALGIANTALTGVSQDGVLVAPVSTNAATTQVRAFVAQPGTAAASFTCGAVYGYRSLNSVKGSGSTITNQYGFYADDQTNGANNYGFTSAVAKGAVETAGSLTIGRTYTILTLGTSNFTTIGASSNVVGVTFTATGVGSGTGTVQPLNKWNIYASGTAANYMAGDLTVDGLLTNAGNVVGTRDIVQNIQSAGYTLALTDAGKHIYMNSVGAYTIPANSSVVFPIGTAITFYNPGAASTIAITTDTLILGGIGTTGTRTLAQYGVATIMKVAATTWVITGSGLT
jgi:hypothetical protein